MNLRPQRRQSVHIDITPLIDVVFLMLIFFMVSTTFDHQAQLKVELPQASAQADQKQPPRQIELKIDAAGHYYLNNRELVQSNAATLARALRKVSAGKPDMPIVVYGDEHAPYQAMITVMDVAGQIGMSRLRFVARQPATPQAAQPDAKGASE